jgi:hypothetical protein
LREGGRCKVATLVHRDVRIRLGGALVSSRHRYLPRTITRTHGEVCRSEDKRRENAPAVQTPLYRHHMNLWRADGHQSVASKGIHRKREYVEEVLDGLVGFEAMPKCLLLHLHLHLRQLLLRLAWLSLVVQRREHNLLPLPLPSPPSSSWILVLLPPYHKQQRSHTPGGGYQ